MSAIGTMDPERAWTTRNSACALPRKGIHEDHIWTCGLTWAEQAFAFHLLSHAYKVAEDSFRSLPLRMEESRCLHPTFRRAVPVNLPSKPQSFCYTSFLEPWRIRNKTGGIADAEDQNLGSAILCTYVERIGPKFQRWMGCPRCVVVAWIARRETRFPRATRTWRILEQAFPASKHQRSKRSIIQSFSPHPVQCPMLQAGMIANSLKPLRDSARSQRRW